MIAHITHNDTPTLAIVAAIALSIGVFIGLRALIRSLSK